MKNYVYIFTRQDISPEQQAVQSSHATLKLGYNMGLNSFNEKESDKTQLLTSDPDETYFTLVGVRDLDALYAVTYILDKFDISYETFFEPDLNDGEPTSIAVYPLPEDARGPLMAFNLLKMK